MGPRGGLFSFTILVFLGGIAVARVQKRDACATVQWQCTNGGCIGAPQYCDGFPDCADDSDEPAGCSGLPTCVEGEVACRHWDGSYTCMEKGTRCGSCDPPDDVKNAVFKLTANADKASFDHGEKVDYQCEKDGMIMHGGSNKRKCEHGVWTDPPFECEWKRCGFLDHPRHGRREHYDNEPTGTARFTCNPGYTMRGRRLLRCLVGGEWTPEEAPTCHPVMCPEPEDIAHGHKFQESPDGVTNDFGSVVTYNCDENFMLEGSARRQCSEDGQWDGKDPVCIEAACPKIEPFENGKVTYNEDKIVVYTTAYYKCDEHADLFPDDPDYAVCTPSEAWSHNPRCKKQAKVLLKENQKIADVTGRRSRPIYSETWLKHGSRIRQTCDSGYELYRDEYLDRHEVVSTNDNGQWKPEIVSCKEKRCEVPRRDHASLEYNGGTPVVWKIEHGDEVSIKCDPQYELRPGDKAKHRCYKGHLDVGSCIEKRCEMPKEMPNTKYNPGYSPDRYISHNEVMTVNCPDDGYELVYDDGSGKQYFPVFRTRCRFGKFQDPSIPSCKEKRCDVPRRDHASIKYRGGTPVDGKIDHDVRVIITCDDKYELRLGGKAKHRCNKGQLDIGNCDEKKCKLPKEMTHTKYTQSHQKGDFIMHDKAVKLSCESGFEFSDGSENVDLRCQYGELENDANFPLECNEKRCDVPRRGHASFEYKGGTPLDGKIEHGVVIFMKCYPQYELRPWDKAKHSCIEGHLDVGYCVERKCEMPKKMPHTKYTPSHDNVGFIKHGQAVTLECQNDGYELVNEDESGKIKYFENFTTTCHFGTFQDSIIPACKDRRCALSKIQNKGYETIKDESGKVISGDYLASGHNVSAECSDGRRFQDNATRQAVEIRCDKGYFHNVILCEPRNCSAPTIQNGSVHRWPSMAPLQPTDMFVDNETVRVICDKNFTTGDSHYQMTCRNGDWNANTYCKPEPCFIPIMPGTAYFIDPEGTKVREDTTIEHGVKISIKCEENYTLVNGEAGKNSTSQILTCIYGRLDKDLACQSDRCQVKNVTNGKLLHRGNPLPHPFIDVGQKIRLKCNTGYEIVHGKTVLRFARTNCTELENSPLSCRRKKGTKQNDCRHPSSDEYTIKLVNRNSNRSTTHSEHGAKIIVTCNSEKGSATGTTNSTTTECNDGMWSPRLPKCKSETDEDYSEIKTGCVLPDDDKYKFDNGTVNPGDRVQDRSLTKIACWENTDYYDYDNEDVFLHCHNGNFTNLHDLGLHCSEVLSDKCNQVDHGEVQEHFNGGFRVVCDEGYSLNMPRLTQFRCKDGYLVTERNMSAECKPEKPDKPDDCRLPEILNIKVQQFNKGSVTWLSGSMTVEHDDKVLLNCSSQQEPNNRWFKCLAGKWMDDEPNWDADDTNGSFPECRQAICDPKCDLNFGECIKDNKCRCVTERTGTHCEKFTCSALCEANGGSCPNSNACVCPEIKYGHDCQTTGCSAPRVNVTLPSEITLYEQGKHIDVMTCETGYQLVGDRVLTCRGNDIWQGTASCEKIQKVSYRVHVVTGTHPNAGTYDRVFIKLNGSLGESEEEELKNNLDGKANKFVRGDTNVFEVLFTDVGRITTIWIRTIKTGRFLDYWFLKSIAIYDFSKKTLYQSNVQGWLPLWKDLPFSIKPKVIEVKYKVSVVTGNGWMAGTDGDVFLKLYGKDGESKEIELTNGMDGKWDKFERGDTDQFEVILKDVGSIHSVRIRLSAWGSWTLQNIIIYDPLRQRKYTFQVEKPLSGEMSALIFPR